MHYPNFSDRTTKTGALSLIVFTALTLALPFAARALVPGPGVTEVSVDDLSVRDSSGAPLECDTVAQPFTGESSQLDWQWDCGETQINARKDSTADEQDSKLALARYMRRATFENVPDPAKVEEPAPRVLLLEGEASEKDFAAAIERDGTTYYFFLTGENAREYAQRLVEAEAR